MRVSISGTHSSGKTSLFQCCQEGLRASFPGRVDFIHEVARDVIAAGLPLNEEATVDSYLLYIQFQLQAERRATREHVVSDRSLVDLLAYIETNNDPRIPRRLVDVLREIMWFETRYFDVYCYLPIEFGLELDGVRSADAAYQRAVDDTLRSILDRYGVVYMPVAGSVSERCDRLLALFEE